MHDPVRRAAEIAPVLRAHTAWGDEHRGLRLAPVLRAHPEADAPMFRAPFMPAACAAVSAPAVGLARTAASPPRAREAIVLADEAEFHARRTAAAETWSATARSSSADSGGPEPTRRPFSDRRVVETSAAHRCC